MQKARRQQLILQSITTDLVERQDQLVDMLSNAGFKVTQASISRDLDELNIVKIGGRYSVKRDDAEKYVSGILDIIPAGKSLLVVKCNPGFASAVAFMIDSINSKNIVGTIAGDDTIFVAVNGSQEQMTVMSEISNLSKTN